MAKNEKYTVRQEPVGWVVINEYGFASCTTGYADRDKERAERIAGLLNDASATGDKLRQGEIALVALGRIYDTVNQILGKYQDDDSLLDGESVLEDIERFREISGAAMYEIYRLPHLAPDSVNGD